MKFVAVAVLALAAGACVNAPKENFAARAQECGAGGYYAGSAPRPSEERRALANYPRNTGLGAGGKCATDGSTWRQVNAAQGAQRMNNNQPGGGEIPTS